MANMGATNAKTTGKERKDTNLIGIFVYCNAEEKAEIVTEAKAVNRKMSNLVLTHTLAGIRRERRAREAKLRAEQARAGSTAAVANMAEPIEGDI